MGRTSGTLDYRDDRFVARFPYDAAIVAEIKALKHGARAKAADEWVIERHRPSVARLLRIGRDHSWHFTAEARKAIQELQDQAEAAEFSIDVVQGSGGEPWFYCMLGDDYELQQRVRGVARAYLDDADDSWWVPVQSVEARDALLEIAQSDSRMEVSEAAWRLLDGSDEYFATHGDGAAQDEDSDQTSDDLALGGTWEPTDLDYQMHTLSSATQEDGFKVAASLRGTLRPYQIAGVRYLCSASRAFLADEPGLGKTVQALAAIETMAAYPALVICPAPLQRSWLRESQRWLPADKTIVALEGASESVPVVDVLIVSYESLARHQQLLAERQFDAVVADESHALRNREAQRTRAAIEIAANVPTLRLCLSSAPMGDQPIDLAGQLAFLGALDEEFGGFWSFVSRYCAPKDDGSTMRFGSARMDELAQRLRSTCYCRRTKRAVLAQLPAKSRAVHWLSLADREHYAGVEESARETLRALASDPNSAESRKARLEQVERVLHECGRQKTAAIARWVANFLATGEPLALFAQHRDVISALIESFPRAVGITSSDDPAQRQRAIRAFQTGEAQLIICSMHAASVGPALTRAAHVAFAEIAWSAAASERGEEQIHRIGSEQGTTAWYLVGDETIDELVLDVIAHKRVMAGQLHESVLLEVADAIARMTEPRSPSQAKPMPQLSDALAKFVS